MRAQILLLFFSVLSVSFSSCFSARSAVGLADTPPRGWNSYDSFSWIINEEEFLDNAKVVADKLHSFGYEYVVVDFLWYRKNAEGANLDVIGYDSIDEWGRVIPDPERWPSSRGGVGLAEVARKVHDMGLKFGMHAMRGINAQAVNAKAPIFDVLKGVGYQEDGRQWNAADIGLKEMTCGWMKGFMSVNTDLAAGKAFMRSLYRQYAEWGVDFVKLDCVFGDDLDSKQILTVSELLEEIERPILFSLSPGTSVTPSMSDGISEHVNMYRVTGDDWDTWRDVAYHFNVARDFAAANKIGAQGLNGKSWPDLDMLPLGWLTNAGVQQGPHRKCSLTLAEQMTQLTLWAMAKSPLMFGGDLRNIDNTTYTLITNPTVLEINSYSTNNMEFPHVFAGKHKKKNLFLAQKFASLDHAHTFGRNKLRLISCSNKKSKRWFRSEGIVDQICWDYERKITTNNSYCLYQRRPLMTSDEDSTYDEAHPQKLHLLATSAIDTCLSASVNKKLSASERRSILLSACTGNANQMWLFNDDKTLLNNYSGLCGVVELVEENANTNGVRSWIATGKSGEIYLAFFNLNQETTKMSTNIGDLAKVLDRRFLGGGSCQCSEVWSQKSCGVVKDTLSMMVESHGSRLFVLNCYN